MTVPSWKEALPAAPPGGRLQEAWMTSFDQPDPGLLVEHLLPSLLSASYSLSQDLQERSLFFGELSMALEPLRGRLTVISSPSPGAREDSPYPWLWRYVSHFIVGAQSRVVQHAKLWAFHWNVEGKEFLELQIASTNLTTSAFKDQVQAGWKLMLPLGKRASQSARRKWGELVPFLEVLGSSAGEVASARVMRLVALLGRAECPENLTFIASIPGGKSAARRLKGFEVSEIHLMTPTIGNWNLRTLTTWCADAGVIPGKIHLKWISEQHPWAQQKGWVLSNQAREALTGSGVQLECVASDARFIDDHHEADPRWSHAKLYLLRSRRKRLLLVTSANWSLAAWGAGKITPRNFELGVLFQSDWNGLEELGEPFDPPDTIPFCVDRIDEEIDNSLLEWAEASWDGKSIQLNARSTKTEFPITAIISFTGGSEHSISLVDHSGVMPWTDPEHTPLTVRFMQGSEILVVDIFDIRSPTQFAETPLPEIDPTVAMDLREAFLLQRYGGQVVDPENIPSLRKARGKPNAVVAASDYSVQAWLEARSAFKIVDQWQTSVAEAASEPAVLEQVHLDGRELRALYERREGAASRLAAEEFGWRLGEKL